VAKKEFDKKSLLNLKILLENTHNWPDEFVFKFIVPFTSVDLLSAILSPAPVQKKSSRTGKYVSVTCKKLVSSSDEVLAIYEEVSKIKGIISL
jgi:hypothetical protein